MPRRFTENEKARILELHADGKTLSQIAALTHRSKGTIATFIRRYQSQSTQPRKARQKVLSSRENKMIIRTISNSSHSLNSLKRDLKLNCSRSTIHRAIKNCDNLQYCKLQRLPRLLCHHRIAREKWAHDKMAWTEQWKSVIWSDEKKFNLDGPDGIRHYWHDLRKDAITISRRPAGGGGVTVWGCLGYFGIGHIHMTTDTIKSSDYIHILESNLLPYANQIGGKNWILMADNAPMHTSKETKAYYQNNNIQLLEWPSVSPDLNPIENLWGILARRIYEGNKQYNSLQDLQDAISQAWSSVGILQLNTLVDSMPERVYMTIRERGGHTGY